MIIRITLENILSEILSKLDLLPPSYQLETTDEGCFYVKCIFLQHDSQRSKAMADRIEMSIVNIKEAKYIATMSALDALRAVYELEIHDCERKLYTGSCRS